jgi:hypothetical protein
MTEVVRRERGVALGLTRLRDRGPKGIGAALREQARLRITEPPVRQARLDGAEHRVQLDPERLASLRRRCPEPHAAPRLAVIALEGQIDAGDASA